LKGNNRFAKTIAFCIDIEHAEGMRTALANVNADLVSQNNKYVMQITGDNEEGKLELDSFINPMIRYPVIVTTSKLMTTGVDTIFTAISIDIVKNEIIALPPLPEQQVIVSKVETLLEKCNQLQEEIETMNKQSKELLRALFNETFGSFSEAIAF
jgi:hypothetical protein